MKKKWYVVLRGFTDSEDDKKQFKKDDKIRLGDDIGKTMTDAKFVRLAKDDEIPDADKKGKKGSQSDADNADADDDDDDEFATEVKRIKEEFTQTMADTMKAAVDGMKKAVGRTGQTGPQITVYDHIEDDPNAGYKNLGEFGADVAAYQSGHDMPGRMKTYCKVMEDRIGQKTGTGMNESLMEEGGILVPPQMAQGIYERAFNSDSVSLLAMTDSYTVAGNSMTFRKLREDSRVDGSRHGGILAYWLDENDPLTGTQPKFDKHELKLRKLGVLVYATDEMLEDSGMALSQFLTNKAGDAIRFKTNDAIIRGNGTTQPLGFTTTPAMGSTPLLTVNRTSASAVVAEDLSNMWVRTLPEDRGGLMWFYNQEVEPYLDRMHFQYIVTNGGGDIAAYSVPVPDQRISRSSDGTLSMWGRPGMASELFEALGTTGDVILANLSRYVTIIKGGSAGGIQSAMSIHLRFVNGETAFRFLFRIDGQPWDKTAITPYKGTATLSPFVQLGKVA